MGRLFFFLIIPVVLVACGGGSKTGNESDSRTQSNKDAVEFSLDVTPDGVNSAYQGKKTSATLTPKVAFNLLENLFGFSLSKLNLDDSLPESKTAKSVKYQAKHINEEKNGRYSGVYRLIGDINEQGGILTAIWDNYSDDIGSVINGKAVFNIVEVSRGGNILKSTTHYINLQLKDKQQDLLIDGYTIEHLDFEHHETSTIYDVSILNHKTNTWIAFDKFKETILSQDFSSETSDRRYQTSILEGRFYISEIGFVDVSTLESIHRCIPSYPWCSSTHPYIGRLRFKDERENLATFHFREQKKLGKIDLELKPKNKPIRSSTKDWRDFNVWQDENHPPFASLSENYIQNTNVDAIVDFEAGDEDDDELTIIYKWTVNGNKIDGNYTTQLPSSYYKGGDKVRLEIFVTDVYGAKSYRYPLIFNQTVGNTIPTIVAPDITITLGEKAVLDASDSFDIDEQSLSYKWEGDNFYPKISFSTPNKAKTEIKGIHTNGTYNKFSVRVNDHPAIGFNSAPSKDVKLIVLPEDNFSPAIKHEAVSYSKIVTGDINNDGVDDLVTTIENGNVLIMDGAKNLKPIIVPDLNIIPALIADMDNDGLNDIVAFWSNGIRIIKQENQGKFSTSPLASIFLSEENYAYDLKVTDLNNDGLKDIVVLHNKSISIYLRGSDLGTSGDIPFTFLPAEKHIFNTASNDRNSSKMAIGDINNDGRSDVVIFGAIEGNDYADLIIFTQKNNMQFNARVIKKLPQGVEPDAPPDYRYRTGSGLALSDLDGDQRTDILITGMGVLGVFYQSSNGKLKTIKEYHGGFYSELVVKDFNADSKQDVLTTASNEFSFFGDFSIHKQTLDGQFPLWNRYRLNQADDNQWRVSFETIGDYNGDGKLDIVGKNAITKEFMIRYGH